MSQKGEKKSLWEKHFDFIIVDFLCLQISLYLANGMRNGWSNPLTNSSYSRLAVITAMIFICLVFFMEPYSGVLRRTYMREFTSALSFSFILTACMVVIIFFMHISDAYSRLMLLLFIGFSTVLIFVANVFLKRWIRWRTHSDKFAARMILAVHPEDAQKCVEMMSRNLFGQYNPVGIVMMRDPDRDPLFPEFPEEIGGVPVVSGDEGLITYCRKNIVDDVLFYNCPHHSEKYQGILYNMGITVHVNILSMEMNPVRYKIETINGITVLSTGIVHMVTWKKAVKRAMDILGGLVGCLLTGIIALFIAPVIKHQSPGPLFFTQTRVGRGGRPFKIYKFRSMYTDAEERKKELMDQNEMQGLMFKMENDPRIFPFGRTMRKLSLDEFPQFFNVLKGDMSLVGTRPPTMDEYKQYQPHHKSRLAMKPGITGLWQVNGRSQITDFEEVVRLDNEYIRNWGLTLDLEILFKTVWVLFTRRGAK